MGEEKETWNDYSKLVLNELERISENQEKMRTDLESRFAELNNKLSEVKNVEKSVTAQTSWIEKVNDVWSPSQMKEAKDALYKQKGQIQVGVAIVAFIQILVGIGLTIWGHLK
jgi:hypothetical protein